MKGFGFSDDLDSWPIPEDAVMDLAMRLRIADEDIRDPATGEPIDREGAHALADALEVAADIDWTEGLLMDDRDRPAVRWALAEWTGQDDAPDWVAGLSRTPEIT